MHSNQNYEKAFRKAPAKGQQTAPQGKRKDARKRERVNTKREL